MSINFFDGDFKLSAVGHCLNCVSGEIAEDPLHFNLVHFAGAPVVILDCEVNSPVSQFLADILFNFIKKVVEKDFSEQN